MISSDVRRDGNPTATRPPTEEQTMRRQITWLRIAYWTASIADFLVAILVLIPARMAVEGYVYPMGLMSAAAFSWGVMLVLADRKPAERRWMLVPTTLVVGLLGTVALHAGVAGLLPWLMAAPRVGASVVVFGVLAYSLWNARGLPTDA